MPDHLPILRSLGMSPRAAFPLLLSVLLVLVLLPLGCSDDDGGSPTAPVFVSGLSGSWAGSITGRPSQAGATEPAVLRLTVTTDGPMRIERGRYQITYASGEIEAGDLSGAFDHEVYLNEDGETCSWQARFQVHTPQRLEASWFGWTCGPRVPGGSQAGEIVLQRE